ncbi:MAG: serine hydrolase [Chloroflexota bacterium]
MNEELLRDASAYANQWLAFQQRLKEIPAITVTVRLGDEVVLSGAYGCANLGQAVPVTPAHIFRVASHSKWFTATAVMQLKEQHKVRLDDPLGKYIAWLCGALENVTIRQVLNHAAGITRDGYDNDHWQLEHPFPDSAQLRKLVEEGGEVLPPNHRLKYSNIGFSLLGLVIESVSGMPYNRYVREAIVDRLGLQNTGPETDVRARQRMVTGYTSRALLMPRIPLPDVETGAMSPATGFYSTAEDLSRFAAAHFFGNDELISDESKREMQRAYWPVKDMHSYGLGMQVTTINDRQLAGHSGGFPGHSTYTTLDAVDRLAISVLTSESGGEAGELGKSIIKLIDLALEQKPVEDAVSLDRYTGRFASLWGYEDIVRLGDQLFLMAPNSDDPAKTADKLEVVDENTLKIEEKEGYGSPGELVRFTRDASGNILKVTVAGSTAYPEGARQEYLQRRREELNTRTP